METQFLYKEQVKARGWSDTLITKFLPVPDRTAPNPRHKNGAPMKFYSLDRIQLIEQSDLFKAAFKRKKIRNEPNI
ncbi:MAG: hypothetical protein ACKOW9_03165 [Candidatus Paceibacterota bacterium]